MKKRKNKKKKLSEQIEQLLPVDKVQEHAVRYLTNILQETKSQKLYSKQMPLNREPEQCDQIKIAKCL